MQLIMAVVFEGKVFFFLIVGLRFNLWFKKKSRLLFCNTAVASVQLIHICRLSHSVENQCEPPT